MYSGEKDCSHLDQVQLTLGFSKLQHTTHAAHLSPHVTLHHITRPQHGETKHAPHGMTQQSNTPRCDLTTRGPPIQKSTNVPRHRHGQRQKHTQRQEPKHVMRITINTTRYPSPVQDSRSVRKPNRRDHGPRHRMVLYDHPWFDWRCGLRETSPHGRRHSVKALLEHASRREAIQHAPERTAYVVEPVADDVSQKSGSRERAQRGKQQKQDK